MQQIGVEFTAFLELDIRVGIGILCTVAEEVVHEWRMDRQIRSMLYVVGTILYPSFIWSMLIVARVKNSEPGRAEPARG